ncbi:MAG: phosphoribosylformylglycinamidine synthase I [Candidatus Omnitrophica bacterium]|nr:phosphoribosylformylglycinamidine synthase I [Candidatus Omnitrophota bacterium]MDD4012695.1 phosphoribosylformylglycinamidine synthase I [Candidatus Omnitrophota bacterium]
MAKKVRALILRTAGTNCDLETAYAFKMAGADPVLMHVNAVIEKRSVIDSSDILAIPGGFTYGDDIASGKVLANQLKNSLRNELSRFVASGRLVIGICNGFQVLVKMGFLPAVSSVPGDSIDATLSLNDSGKFESRWVYLRGPENGKCVWTRGLLPVIEMPVAHGEGKFIPKDPGVLSKLKKNGQVVFRYCDPSGNDAGYPFNPNGSVEALAGICDPGGRILGMMPHPERHVTYLQHPNWRRRGPKASGMGIGLEVFRSGVSFARKHL